MQKNSSIMDIIKKRVSVRRYDETTIQDREMLDIIKAGLYAPSGKNRQPWRFVLIKDRHIIKQIAKLTVYSRFIRNASALILLYVERRDDYSLEKEFISAGACLQNILLLVTEKGYGSCVIGELFRKEMMIDNILNTDFSKLSLVCGISVGLPVATSDANRNYDLNNYLLCIKE